VFQQDNLTLQEALMVERIRDSLTRPMLISYVEYIGSEGYEPAGISEILLTQPLHQKGWITYPVTPGRLRNVFLTEQAWTLFSLDEWDALDRARIEADKKNNPLRGLY
jgi:hypothetical protein